MKVRKAKSKAKHKKKSFFDIFLAWMCSLEDFRLVYAMVWKGMVEKNSKGLLWIFFDLMKSDLGPMLPGDFLGFGGIWNQAFGPTFIIRIWPKRASEGQN